MVLLKRISLVIFIVHVLISCEVINPEEPIPSFIHIDDIEMVTNYAQEGSNSSNIVDAWVYVDDKFIGGFELPATIPVLAEGEVNLKVRPGIKNSGSTALRLDYPFFAFYEDDNFMLYPDSIVHVAPTARYFEQLSFPWLEDFEGGTFSLSETGDSESLQITTNPEEVYEGGRSAKIELNSADEFYLATSEQSYVLPKSGNDVYLELDYKTSAQIEIRLISNVPQDIQSSSIIILYPKETWNKIYIDLGTSVTANPNALTFQIQFLVGHQSGQENSVTYLDNIKLIHSGI